MIYPSPAKPLLFITYGAGYMFIAEVAWRYYHKHHPFLDWFFEIAELGYTKTFWALVYFHDLILNTGIALVIVLPVYWLVQTFSWSLMILAFLSALGYLLLNMVNHASSFQSVQFVASTAIAIFPVAIAYFLSHVCFQKRICVHNT